MKIHKATLCHTARQTEVESMTGKAHSRATVIDINKFTSIPEPVTKHTKSAWF